MFLGETAVRVRRTVTSYDAANRPQHGVVEDTLEHLCAFDPGGSREPVEVGRAQVVTTPKAYFRAEVDVAAGDQLRIRDRLYDVIGDPAIWRSPYRANRTGTVVELQASSEEG